MFDRVAETIADDPLLTLLTPEPIKNQKLGAVAPKASATEAGEEEPIEDIYIFFSFLFLPRLLFHQSYSI